MAAEHAEAVASFSQRALGEVHLCPNCFDPVFPAWTVCHTCMAPVGTWAAYLPYERIWATAWIAWKASWSVGVRPWHVGIACVVLLFDVLAVVFFTYMHFTFEVDPFDLIYVTADAYPLIGLIFFLLEAAVHAAMAWRIILNGRRVADGTHPRLLPDVFAEDDEWAFGDWDDETGRPKDD